ncbi:uracil-DNA glycosylase [Galactobacter valiniphilus]|uniref:Uracil-DNA glycosylase n=1 Tax=Galactobacter valiniphilus TaxID=2676122 RepID=A0A399JDP1_9MICC|nr:uracil-DNA glycosylase [Galactobacter valiniphilus]RII42369.1 uracil-DNA glycosylase [Galactobacter valiniphilus]
MSHRSIVPSPGLLDSAEAWGERGVHAAWLPVLAPLRERLTALGAALEARAHDGERLLPPEPRVWRALGMAPEAVKVLIVGQDPYPTPGHAVGLSFSTEATVRPLPRSLANIYEELRADVGLTPPSHGDLSAWEEQGVLLLNRTLTVAAGEAGSHARLGWGAVTDAVVAHLGARPGAPVAILWGKHAQELTPLLGDHPIIATAHPSPLSARRGFFGSRPFTRANEALAALGVDPVDWRLPAFGDDASSGTLF